MPDEFFLDPRAVRRSFDRAARTYDTAAVVQREIRTRLLERLDIVRLAPAAVLDLGAGTGHASRELKRRYSSAKVIALDISLPMLRESARQQSLLRRFAPVCADAHRLPLHSDRDPVHPDLYGSPKVGPVRCRGEPRLLPRVIARRGGEWDVGLEEAVTADVEAER